MKTSAALLSLVVTLLAVTAAEGRRLGNPLQNHGLYRWRPAGSDPGAIQRQRLGARLMAFTTAGT